jgi:hypothetical protein
MADNCDAQFAEWLGSLPLISRYEKLFLTGCPKSGTTWLKFALDGHPQIVANGEGRYAWRLFPFVQQALNAFNKDQIENAGAAMGIINADEFMMIMRAFSEDLFGKFLAMSGKPPEQVKVLAEKTPQHVLSVGLLRSLHPTCRFINIVRDPRDAASSALFHFFKNNQNGSKEDFVINFITQSWRMHIEAAINAQRELGSGAFLNIRYEDMHRDEANVLRRCLQFIGVDASEEMVRRCGEAGSFEKLSGGRQRGQVDSKSFYRSGTVGDWKNHLEPGLAHRACQPVAALMQHFGYILNPPVEASVLVGNPPILKAA